jgi:hypothetical protein
MVNSKQLTDITVSELNQKYCSIDGILFDKERKNLLLYPQNKDKTDYTVPDGVLRIERCAFFSCKHLVNVNLPESLEFIGDQVFAYCERLKTITLPKNLKYIGGGAFDYCKNLEAITLSRKTKLGYKAFKEFTGKLVYRD